MNKVSKVITIIFVVMLIAIFNARYSYAETSEIGISMEADKAEYKEGDIVNLNIKISDLPLANDGVNHREINVLDFVLNYDKDIFELNKITYGTRQLDDIAPNGGWTYEYDAGTNVISMKNSDFYSSVNETILNIGLKVKKDFTSTTIELKDIEASGGVGIENNYISSNDVVLKLGNKEDLYLKTSKYKIGDTKEQEIDEYVQGDEYISRISPNTDEDTFIRNLETNADSYKIIDKDGNEVKSALIGTGMKIILSKEGCQDIELELVVIGDINGDGITDITDLVKVRQQIQQIFKVNENVLEFNNIQNKAGDINEDLFVDITDLVKIRRHIQEIDIL